MPPVRRSSLALAVTAVAAALLAPVGQAAAAPPGWHRSAHGASVQVRARPSDGRTTVVQPVDRTGRALSRPGALRPRALSATPLSTWHVIYDAAFQANDPARQAFDRAVVTWSRAVASTQVITVAATLKPFADDPSLLGSAGPVSFFTPPAPNDSFYYPVALANAMSDTDNDPGAVDDVAHADIDAEFSDNPDAFDYDASTTDIATKQCTPPGGTTPVAGACIDFESIVLHELGHGLGFLGSAYEDADNPATASYGFDPLDPRPYVFDLFAETGDGTGVVDFPSDHSAALHQALSTNDLYWIGPEGAAADRGRQPQLWAPDPYEPGSTYSHLDDELYASGDPESLMTPYAEGGDITRDPGEVTLGMLRDMGWTTPGLPGSAFTPLSAARVLDTGSTPVPSGGFRDLDLASRVPRGATAVVLNLTTVLPAAKTTLWAYAVPRFDGAPIPRATSLVTYPGDVRAALVTVPLSTGGAPARERQVRVLNTGGSARVQVEVLGYYAPRPTASLYFHPMAQHRFGDTTTGVGLTKRRLGPKQLTNLLIAGRGGVPANAVAAVLTVTAIRPSTRTYVSAFNPATTPVGSTVNLAANAIESNQAVVRLSARNVRLRNAAGTTDLQVDVSGWYDTNASGGLLLRNVLPERVEATTTTVGREGTTVLVADGSYGVPSSAKAVVINLYGGLPPTSNYLQAFAGGTAVPPTIALPLAAHRSAGVMATVPLGTGAHLGEIGVRAGAGPTGFAVDVQGWFGAP